MCGHLAIQHHGISMTTHATVTIEFCLDCCTFMNFVFLLSFFQLCTAFSSTNKSSQFCPVFRGFLFSKKKNYLRQWRTVWEFLYDIQGEIAVIQLKFTQPHVSSRNTCSSTCLAFGKQYGSNHGSWHEF